MANFSPNGRTTPESCLFEVVAEEVFRRYGRTWKPSTVRVNRNYLRNQILPSFRGRPIGDITSREVRSWFSTLHLTPAAANRSLPILSVIMQQAEIYGYRIEESNPCKRIRRHKEPHRERFLTVAEISRLGQTIAQREAGAPLQSGIVRLLMLTGCRQSEIRTLRWKDYREGHIFLADSKTGPRKVWLCSPARRVLSCLPQQSDFIFPARVGSGPISAEALYGFWRPVRTEANLVGLRLHDLRHTYASFALERGETVVMIGRLLGHRDPSTTLKYTHPRSVVLAESVERVARALAW